MASAWAGIHAPVSPDLYPLLSVLLITGGLGTTSFFWVYEAVMKGRAKSKAEEVLLAVLSSFLLGFGSLFLLLWCGVFV